MLLKKEDFILIIMTSFQKEMLIKYSADKNCIDGTHGLNNYDFHLYSLLVIDEFKNGYPVSFCFSNRSCEQLFEIFFNEIKNVSGKISCNTFVSYDGTSIS